MIPLIYTCKPSKVSLYDNRATRYTAAQVKAKTGADIVFNGSLFDMTTYQPNCDVKINGVVLNNDPYTYFGYGWKNGELPRVAHTDEMPTLDNFISCLWAIHNGEKQSVNDNAAGIGGTRGRTAFGFKADGSMVIICTSDRLGALTLSATRDKLFSLGCVNGIILDGGGSSQCITPTESITSSRIVSNFVCVTLDKIDKTVPIVNDKKEDDTISTLNIIQPNYKWAYGATLRKKTDYIVLHHVGAVGSFTPEQIHAEHLRKGWRGIGYNYYVRKDGTIYHGREENAAGGHTLNYNLVSIGICFEGNFEVEKMPLAQKEAGQKLVADVLTRYPSAKVVRHKDLNATACPGANFPFADITAEPLSVPTQTITYKVQIDLTDETKAERLTSELAAKGYTSYITTEVKI